MKWKAKAQLQHAVSLLPPSLSYSVYYWIQRHFGELRKVNPVTRLTAGIGVCKRIKQFGRTPIGGTFLEVGTGRRINTPVAYWLNGARKIITVDLNPYLKEELVREDIAYIAENKEKIKRLFDNYFFEDRFRSLLDLANGEWHLSDLLELCKVDYLAPQDAANLPVSAGSVDFHTSYTVLEHIPPDILKLILQEGKRVITTNGLFIHRIDCSDHFSHSDRSLSSINFLQYNEQEWNKIAGNRYMYMNRLRVDDFQQLLQESSHRILDIEPDRDLTAVELIKNGNLKLSNRFKDKSDEVIATIGFWIVSEKYG